MGLFASKYKKKKKTVFEILTKLFSDKSRQETIVYTTWTLLF